MFELARRNGLPMRFPDVGSVREAYRFSDLQSFLDIYYEGAKVLVQERDFHDLAWAYLQRAREQGVRHAEIFFDPQTHTARGVAFETVLRGLCSALKKAREEAGLGSRLILCFLRHLNAESAMEALEQALPFRADIAAVGLDSSEVGHPPSKFKAVFERARKEGFLAVAHAGEEGPPEYIHQALDLLKVRRVDHGVRCLEDAGLVRRLAEEGIPLTVCPLSNVRLRVFRTLKEHNLKKLLDAGLCATVNSDDPAYFGGYAGENLSAAARALGLSREDIRLLAANSVSASFLPEADKRRLFDEVDAFGR